jgi:CRISPR-associated endonuclease Csn1
MELVRDRAVRVLARAKGMLPKEAFEDIERAGAFLARQLVDTAYLARVARQYLWTACENPNNVWVIPGRMTEFMRRKWGLNKLLYGNRPDPDDQAAAGQMPKRRDDHRHHAIDAFVVGLTDRAMLQRVSTAAARAQERTIEEMPEPWEKFREDLKACLDRMIVSFKPEHGAQGRLHEDTAYGIIRHPEREGGATLVYRKPLEALNANEIERVRDRSLRQKLKDELGGLLFDESTLDAAKQSLQLAKRGGEAAAIQAAKAEVDRLKAAKKNQKKSGAKDLKTALTDFGKKHGIRHVRLLKTEANYIPISRQNGTAYKALTAGENHCVDVIELPSGAWTGEGITVFAANQVGHKPIWAERFAGARQLMRLQKGDLVKLEHEGRERLFRVVKLVPSNDLLWLAEHKEAGNLQQRNDDANDDFRWLYLAFSQMKTRLARKVTVDILGRVRDPGPPS